jgi:hypothetical protein
MQGTRHHAGVVKDQAIGQQVVVLDDLALLATVVFRNDSAVAGLALVRLRLNRGAQLGVSDVLEDEPRTNPPHPTRETRGIGGIRAGAI